METNEIMNENIVETIEESVTTNSGKVLKVAGSIGLTVAVGFVAYKYAVKPLIAKHKAKKEEGDATKYKILFSDEMDEKETKENV